MDDLREFSKDDTLLMKGVAIILMMTHHLLAFPQKLPQALQPIWLLAVPGTDYAGILQLLAAFGKICVPAFFFLAGFGQYRAMMKKGSGGLLGRLKRFYLSYWKVFVLAVPVALIFFGNQEALYESSNIYVHYNTFDLFSTIRSFFGAEAYYNSEWWFIKPWVTCTLLLPLWARLIEKHTLPVNLLFVAGLAVCYHLGQPFTSSTVWNLVFGQTAYGLCFYIGTVLAKDYEFEKMQRRFQKHGMDSMPVLLIMLIVLILFRVGWTDYNMERSVLIVPPLMLVMSLLLQKAGRHVQGFLHLYGRHSTTIWLTHTFLCFYFLPCQRIVYAPRYAVLILPWFMALCLGAAVLIELFWKGIGKLAHR